MRVWLAGSPWRLAGAWLALAGLVASAGLRVLDLPFSTVALLVLLVDPAWGALWTQFVGQADMGSVDRRSHLPYAREVSPAVRLHDWYQPLPAILMAGVLAWLLGGFGLPFTGVVLLLAVLGWLAARAGLADSWHGWLLAVVRVALPFSLGVMLTGPWPDGPTGLWLAGLAVGFTLLAAAEQSGTRSGTMLLAGLGSSLVIGVALATGSLLLVGVATLLAAGPLLLLVRPESALPGAVQVWWWLLAIVASLGLGWQVS